MFKMSSEVTNLAGEQGQGGFVVPVEVKFINSTIGHGVFALHPIKRGTLLWTSKCVTSHTIEEATAILEALSPTEKKVWLRQTFVLSADPLHICSNPTDPGRYMNHSFNPNSGYASEEMPSVALRDVAAGEELTCDYSGLGSPEWYQNLCNTVGCMSTADVVAYAKDHEGEVYGTY
jgi:hypothetical protein